MPFKMAYNYKQKRERKIPNTRKAKIMTGLEILGFEKVNGVNETKVNEIAESIKKDGWKGCPILVYGNTLISGSHRLAALEKLNGEDFDIDFECAEDVSDIIEDKINGGMDIDDIFNYTDYLRAIFEDTWVEEYKDEIKEW